jgi:transcriptional regulator with XRE-family HTH domain
MDFARHFLRAVRGRRSQVAFARRLGYASNVAAEWESGRREPSAASALSACAGCGIDVTKALVRFNAATSHLIPVQGKGRHARIEALDVANWLRAQRARVRTTEVAQRTGLSESKLSRIFSGKSGVSLGDFFAIVQAVTGRVTDLIAALVDVSLVPEAAGIHARVEASRELAFTEPWTSAVIALLDTEDYRASRVASRVFVAKQLGIEQTLASRCLNSLRMAGLIRKRRGKYHVVEALTVDTRDPARAASLRRHWARASTERLASPGSRDVFAYNVFSVSRADFERIRELQKQYFREARAIVAGSRVPEVAGLLTLHLARFGPA